MLMFNYLFLLETYEPVARDTYPPPFGKILKSWIFSIEACIQITFLLISFHFCISVLKTDHFFWSTLKTSPPLSGSLLLIC